MQTPQHILDSIKIMKKTVKKYRLNNITDTTKLSRIIEKFEKQWWSFLELQKIYYQYLFMIKHNVSK